MSLIITALIGTIIFCGTIGIFYWILQRKKNTGIESCGDCGHQHNGLCLQEQLCPKCHHWHLGVPVEPGKTVTIVEKNIIHVNECHEQDEFNPTKICGCKEITVCLCKKQNNSITQTSPIIQSYYKLMNDNV